MSNVKSIISRHNKAQIRKPLNPPEEIKDNCNCRIKNSCPLEGNCNVRNIVYQAEVVTPQSDFATQHLKNATEITHALSETNDTKMLPSSASTYGV